LTFVPRNRDASSRILCLLLFSFDCCFFCALCPRSFCHLASVVRDAARGVLQVREETSGLLDMPLSFDRRHEGISSQNQVARARRRMPPGLKKRFRPPFRRGDAALEAKFLTKRKKYTCPAQQLGLQFKIFMLK
jgi:hypothetical protein